MMATYLSPRIKLYTNFKLVFINLFLYYFYKLRYKCFTEEHISVSFYQDRTLAVASTSTIRKKAYANVWFYWTCDSGGTDL